MSNEMQVNFGEFPRYDMKFTAVVCPHCGAAIRTQNSMDLHCEYCDLDIHFGQNETSVSSVSVKQWKKKRRDFILLHFAFVFMAWIMAFHNKDFQQMIFLLAGFATFFAFPIILGSSKPVSLAEKQTAKKIDIILGEYLFMFLASVIASSAGAILGNINF
ncbi:MAG: hypothetical protein IJM19_05140 [Ruminococcus sp.]|nr:hypothetical protein [Ruminococcus sp.]